MTALISGFVAGMAFAGLVYNLSWSDLRLLWKLLKLAHNYEFHM